MDHITGSSPDNQMNARSPKVVDGLVPQGRPWKARVCATIQRLQTHPDGTRVCFIEDGSAMVAGTLEASAQRVFFGGE